jgi:two-component system chemotaxis sensor kinase CheA
MAADPYRYFRVEARELLGQLSEGILALERGATDAALVPRLLRDAHTLKGAARVVRLPALADEVHRLEDLLAGVQARGLPVEGAVVEPMLALLDRIEAGLAALAPPPAVEAAGPREPRAAAAAEEVAYMFRPDVDDIEVVTQGLASVQAELRRLETTTAGLDDLRRLAEVIEDQLAIHAAAPGVDRGQRRDEGLRAIAGDVRRRLSAMQRDCTDAVERASRELRLAADATARLRLVPARSMFRFLERATRDAAQAEGKPVRFLAEGTELRLEPEMLGALQAALLHLVRNAVVHGVEGDTRQREQAGKPPEATVRVSVERVGQHVRFACEDDGAGIDVAGVRQALERRRCCSTPA